MSFFTKCLFSMLLLSSLTAKASFMATCQMKANIISHANYRVNGQYLVEVEALEGKALPGSHTKDCLEHFSRIVKAGEKIVLSVKREHAANFDTVLKTGHKEIAFIYEFIAPHFAGKDLPAVMMDVHFQYIPLF